MNDDVCAVVERTAEIATCAESVVDLRRNQRHSTGSGSGCAYNDGHASLVRDFNDSLEVRNVVLWVSNALQVDGLGLVVDELFETLRLVSADELSRDAEPREEDLELVVGAAIEVGSRNDVVSSSRERGDGHELSGLAGGCCDCGDATFESRYALLEDINSGLRKV